MKNVPILTKDDKRDTLKSHNLVRTLIRPFDLQVN